MIVNLTNDSWYGTWAEPYQHLYMTLARAVEFRRPVVRATNTGISTVILANGDVLEKSPLQKEWTHIFNVPYSKEEYKKEIKRWDMGSFKVCQVAEKKFMELYYKTCENAPIRGGYFNPWSGD